MGYRPGYPRRALPHQPELLLAVRRFLEQQHHCLAARHRHAPQCLIHLSGGLYGTLRLRSGHPARQHCGLRFRVLHTSHLCQYQRGSNYRCRHLDQPGQQFRCGCETRQLQCMARSHPHHRPQLHLHRTGAQHGLQFPCAQYLQRHLALILDNRQLCDRLAGMLRA